MKKGYKITLTVVAVGVVLTTVYAMVRNDKGSEEQLKTVNVQYGNLEHKAIAVGAIEPRVEVDVKSKISGVIEKLYVDAGQYVEAGAPLLEIKPTPTPQEVVDARREIERMEITYDDAKRELDRIQALKDKQLVAEQAYEERNREFKQARVNLQAARERLDLIQKGSVTSFGQEIKSVVTAPISGFILEKSIEIGDPVVPLTSYQEGTVLMTMANMDDLLFRGTVDEIDVGKLKEGMPAQIKVGALPDANVRGVLSKISLKAQNKDNTIVFPIEVQLTSMDENVLRAGFSANAEIMVDKRDHVLLIPERLLSISGDTTSVKILLDDNKQEDRVIETGLSDAINIEVIEGLEEGDKVVENEMKTIQ